MRIRQVAQRAEDLDRAVDFYARLLHQEVTAKFDPPGLAFFVLDGVRLLLDGAVPPATIYFEVPDVAAEVDRLRADGVEVTSEPHTIFRHAGEGLGPDGTEEQMAFVRDSEGNTVGLISTRPA
jgi:methylmalonyl-CoA/ethylmalonyl-CoA epimerase